MAINIKDNFLTEKWREKEYYDIKMEIFIKDTSNKVNAKVLDI